MEEKSVKRRIFNQEFKVEAVKLALEGEKPVAQIAVNLGVGGSTLNRWVREYRQQQNPEDISPGMVASRQIAQLLMHLKKNWSG